MSAAAIIPVAVNSICSLCKGSGWRYVAKHAVVRCECRAGKTKVVAMDHKSNAAGER